MTGKDLKVSGFVLQESPLVYVAVIPGNWLLKHSTPQWRAEDPEAGFQRVVRLDRARKIATGVLEQKRTFPNAIVLATDISKFDSDACTISLPSNAKFLVVDGQHRLWAQHYSEYEAHYACTIHMKLSEVDMANLFLEINDNQRRVPSSLRWDLVRLVRPIDDPDAVAASELTFDLATDEKSPLFQRIDLTGEQDGISLKQGSVAPELKLLLGSKKSAIGNLDYDTVFELLIRYFAAIKSRNPDLWNKGKSPFYKGRTLRALLRLLPKVVESTRKIPAEILASDLLVFVAKIDIDSISAEKLKAIQGPAGIQAITEILEQQMFGGKA